MKTICILTLLGAVIPAFAASLSSPDGLVVVDVDVNAAGRLCYNVAYQNTVVVEPSELGITVNGVDLGQGVALGASVTSEVNQTYSTRGNQSVAVNHYKAWDFPVEHAASGRQYHLQFRVSNEGVGYRYIVPGKGTQHVDGERSSWTLMAGLKTWFFERNSDWKLKSYAGEWLSTDIDAMETISSVGPIQGTPLVFELPDGLGYAAITKAATYDYSGMRLKATGGRTFVADFTEGTKGFDVEGTITTPWRATLLASDLNALVNNHLVANLNPAPDPELFADMSYIKPGRSVWRWHSLGTGANRQEEQHYADLAAEIGFEYTLIDAKWNEWGAPWDDITKICEASAAKNVGVWIWVHSKDIRDPANDYAQMKSYLDKAVEAGVVGIKTDFMDSEAKQMVDFEIAFLTHCAERQLMVNFHGCHASTGEWRTFPNEVTREGIRGLELNNMKQGPLPASHNAALPFTRFLVGHGDYTPLGYASPGVTTWAHQLATTIMVFSPSQSYCEQPDFLMGHPIAKKTLHVLQAIPTVWDETVVLPGSAIGDLAAIARRSGDRWFVSVLNGQHADRSYDIDLSFLAVGSYTAELVTDDSSAERVSLIGINPRANLDLATDAIPFKVEQLATNRLQRLPVQLAPSGGAVLMLTRN